MKEITYKCDLCHAIRDMENLIGLKWSPNGMVAAAVPTADAHVCKKCVDDLKEITRK